MGTWDTSLYGGDLPLDIKAEYYEQLCEGHTPEEAAALVWKVGRPSLTLVYPGEIPCNSQ